jgi:hypothetical protein
MDISTLTLGMIASYYSISCESARLIRTHDRSGCYGQGLHTFSEADHALVLENALNLLSACVDVMSSNARLNATRAMDLSQMCVQAMWATESPLKQVPHFESDVHFLQLSDPQNV